MRILDPLKVKLIAIFLLVVGTIVSYGQCKQISADAKIVKTSRDNELNRSIIVEIKESKLSLEISLFGPHRLTVLRSNKTEFNNLEVGKYLIVVAGKREEDNYCPKSINVTIN